MTSVENFPILSPFDQELINQLNNIPSSGIMSDLRRLYPSGLILDVHTPTVMGGINLGMMTTNINGLQCFIQPFPNMQHSSYRVFLGGVEVASGDITQAAENYVPFYIRPELVFSLLGGLESGIYELYASIRRPASNNEEETPRLIVKIDVRAPGGFDPDPSTPEHDKLLPVTATLGNPGVIGASDIANGVRFEVPPYEGMALFDTLTLSVAGRLVTHLLENVNEVGRPVTILVEPAKLQDLPDNAEVIVIYRPHDETHNASTWSRRALFLVERTAGLLNPPLFEDESLELPRSTIDLAALRVSTTAVIVPTGRLVVGELVTLTWRLTLASGQTLSGQQTQEVVSRRENLVFDVPHDQAVTLGAGRLVVSYVAAQSGRSSSAVANLINELKVPLSLGEAHSQAVAASYIIVQGRPPEMPPASANAVFDRGASGGVPPYNYQSSNSAVATVDQSGRVVAAGNGTAQIFVTDSAGNRASYAITFSGVRTVRREDSRWWVASPLNDPRRPEYYALTRAQMRQFWEQYRGEAAPLSVPAFLGWPESYYWTSENILGNSTAWAVNFHSLSPNFSGTAYQ